MVRRAPHTRGAGSPRAMEFLTLTAARSNEIRLATWDEIHLDEKLWIIPATRMKMRREHRIPLMPAMIALRTSLLRMAGSDLIFPSTQSGPMSDRTLSAVMKRMHTEDTDAGRKGWVDPVLSDLRFRIGSDRFFETGFAHLLSLRSPLMCSTDQRGIAPVIHNQASRWGRWRSWSIWILRKPRASCAVPAILPLRLHLAKVKTPLLGW
jgi:hypothetical protein